MTEDLPTAINKMPPPNAVPSGSSQQPYYPVGNQTRAVSPTHNLALPGHSQPDSRSTQSNVGRLHPNVSGHPEYNTGYSQSNAGYPQYHAGYSQSSAGYPQYNNGYPQSNAGHPQFNAEYLRSSTGYLHERSPSPSRLPPSNMQEGNLSPNSYVVNSDQKREPPSPPPPFPPPSVPGSPRNSDDMSLSPASLPSSRGTIRLPSAPPQLRPPSKLSLYSTYSFYQLDDESRTPSPSSPSSPQHLQKPLQTSGPGPQNTANTLTIEPQRQRSPRTSPSPSTSPTPRPPNQQPGAPTAEDYLFMGIQHHEANRLTESARCFQLAATLNGGCGVGMLMWGLALRHAWGTQKDEKTAFRWLRRAAEAAVGDLEAAREGKELVAVQVCVFLSL